MPDPLVPRRPASTSPPSSPTYPAVDLILQAYLIRFATQDAAADPAHKYTVADLVVAAVREQLGLRLEKQNASLAITIVDRAGRPSANRTSRR